MKRYRVMWWSAFTALLLVVDQMTKYWAQTELQKVGEIPVIKGVFSLTYVRNSGAAFGILQGKTWLLLILTAVILVGGFIYFRKHPDMNRLMLTAGGMVLAGAVGNLLDRLRLSYVIDFLDVRLIRFPVFNVADCCVVIGVILMAICVIRGKTE